MAITTPRRRQQRDPEGRMSLRDHLQELRKRFVRSAVAVALGAVGGWYAYRPLFEAASRPVQNIVRDHEGIVAYVNFAQPTLAFNLQIQSAIVIGVFLASPVWLYQLWAFITPGLTSKERRSAFAFVGAAAPLFCGGALMAWLVLPKAIEFLYDFIPDGGSAITDAPTYFSFVTRIVLAFGLAFVLPVIIVSLNLVGLLPGRMLLHHWRIIVFSCFLFAAVATPSPEATSMCLLAGAMCLLFAIAIAICLLSDRRKARRGLDLESLPDDVASPL